MFPLVKSLGRFHDQASMYILQSYKYYLKACICRYITTNYSIGQQCDAFTCKYLVIRLNGQQVLRDF